MERIKTKSSAEVGGERQKRSDQETLFTVWWLRKAGLTNPQIAQELNLEIQTVKNLAHRLIQEGKLEPRQKGGVSEHQKNLSQYHAQIASLWIKGGLNTVEIAERLKKTPSTIQEHLINLFGSARNQPTLPRL